MKVLVTGASGFIGSRVVAHARRAGHEVHAMPRGGASASAARSELWRNVDAVVHCAAAMSGDAAAHRAVTIDGTSQLLAAMRDEGVRHIVLVSSFAVYDVRRLRAHAVLDETAPLRTDLDHAPPYVAAKLAQERLVHEHATREAFRFTILRPGIVFGPGRTWSYHLGATAGASTWISFAGASLLATCYVEHCADAIVRALSAPAAAGATLNLVDDDLPTRARFMRALAAHTTPRPRIVDIPWPALALLSRLRGSASATGMHARCKPVRYSNAAAKMLLDWKPILPFEQALAASVAPART